MNDQLTEHVIGCAFRVHNTLGYGFLESVYEKALSIEFSKLGIRNQSQASVQVYYEGNNVGDFSCDILVEDRLIIELKSVSQIALAHEVQLVNYLVATKIDLGLVINFGPDKVEVRRKYRLYPREN